MRKVLSAVAVLLLCASACLTLTGCAGDAFFKRDVTYLHAMYDEAEGKFIPSGNSITFGSDYRYREKYISSKDAEGFTVEGGYVIDRKSSSLAIKADNRSLDTLINNYKKELKALGYSNNQITLLTGSIISSTELFSYKKNLFKNNGIVAARTDKFNKNTVSIDGVYNMKNLFGLSSSTEVRLSKGHAYSASLNEDGETVFVNEIGTYELNGSYITARATDSQIVGRFLLAEITVPVSYLAQVSEDGTLDSNDVITVIIDRRITVIVQDFYTLSDLK